MTLQQIQELILDDLFIQILHDLVDLSQVPEGESSYSLSEGITSKYDRLIVHSSLIKPSLSEFEAAFTLKKQEMITKEEARLAEIARIDAIKLRLSVFDNDPALVCHRLGITPTQPNHAITFRDIILNNDIQLLGQMEVEWAAVLAEQSTQAATSLMDTLRSQRDLALAKSDFTQLADAPLTSIEKTEWREYRDFLRRCPDLYNTQRLIEPIVLTFAQWKPLKEQYKAAV